MSEIVYLTLEQAQETHRQTIVNSGGGLFNCLNIGQLESVLIHIKNDDYYPTFVDKLTHLFYSVCKFHTFEDGNKRLALTLSLQFLLLNGCTYIASTFMRDYENITYYVAFGKITKGTLRDILQSSMNGEFGSEEIKLKIYNAIK